MSQETIDQVQYNAETQLTEKQSQSLALYEEGAYKESHGRLKDAILCYDRAIKMYEYVERLYRKKLQYEYEQSVKERELLQIRQGLKGVSLDEQKDGSSEETQEGEEEPSEEIDPCWLLDLLSDDLLLEIISILIVTDPHAHYNFSVSCKKIASLSFTSTTYRLISKAIFPGQIYAPSAIKLNNITPDQELMVKNWDFNWEMMLNDRPYLKFNGVYISRVNYISEGGRYTSMYSPLKLVTYFRYMRFYKDGTVLKLTTVDEPDTIVPHFEKANRESFQDAHISQFTLELDGHLILRRNDSKYEYIEELEITNFMKKKCHRLTWVSSYYQDEEGDRKYFCMTKEKPYNFSGVRHIREQDVESQRLRELEKFTQAWQRLNPQ
ncbi:hypothetical protein WICPIJ_009423 [Wickerhamomyces pijperi]|uniref:F-box protein Hrt3/FBXO9 C-terminal domain-containing protein n=1 Tax=Wickerhamomyces pijperi TaxID=599730 RepID=A0A9P8TDN6_WICPI|nr:hypothetical protein WICPIJ_009423 [Wickerhamomyces pijperi]